jgi:hypothetical protein
MNEKEKLAARLAQAALQGFFSSDGFDDMQCQLQRKRATQKVMQILDKEFGGEPKQVKE